MKTRCNACYGSGQIMGGGMMHVECPCCEGMGFVFKDSRKKKVIVIDKQSKSYREAIKKIQSLNEKISDEQAEKIFEHEFNNISKKDNENEGEKSS